MTGSTWTSIPCTGWRRRPTLRRWGSMGRGEQGREELAYKRGWGWAEKTWGMLGSKACPVLVQSSEGRRPLSLTPSSLLPKGAGRAVGARLSWAEPAGCHYPGPLLPCTHLLPSAGLLTGADISGLCPAPRSSQGLCWWEEEANGRFEPKGGGG